MLVKKHLLRSAVLQCKLQQSNLLIKVNNGILLPAADLVTVSNIRSCGSFQILNGASQMKYRTAGLRYIGHKHNYCYNCLLLKTSNECSINSINSCRWFTSGMPSLCQNDQNKLLPLKIEDNSPANKTEIIDPSKTTRLKIDPQNDMTPNENSSRTSLDRNFITAVRAMSEFLLKPSHLVDLRSSRRRSPFDSEPRIIVYWRKDVEKRAMKVWGTKEALDREKAKRERDLNTQNKKFFLDFFNMKRLWRQFQQRKLPALAAAQEATHSPAVLAAQQDAKVSSRVVYAAIAINGINFVLKLGAWLYTGSHSLFAEALHSLADTTNQLILAYGIHKSMQSADTEHPYGYSNMRYVSSLLSGAMIFCVGAGLSIQHGISGLITPPEVTPLHWAFGALGVSLVTEGCTLLVAIHAIRNGARKNKMTFYEYVIQGEDPSVNVVLLEDAAAVAGVGVALASLGLTSVLGTTLPDAMGSCIIGLILASVSGFIIHSNITALVGRSIPQKELETMNKMMEQDVMVRALHDVKGIDMGVGLVRYKAEVDFDGRELTRSYLAKQDISALLQEMKSLKTNEEAEMFMLNHGENIVDTLGAEIDRIEQRLKKAHPEIRHCDLEIL